MTRQEILALIKEQFPEGASIQGNPQLKAAILFEKLADKIYERVDLRIKVLEVKINGLTEILSFIENNKSE